MVQGRLDTRLPYEESQLPYFRLLGTPAADKKFVVVDDAGHCPPKDRFLREALPFLDRYLGPTGR
jgi:hypothetical protein